MAFLRTPVSATYLHKAIVFGLLTTSPLVFSQVKDSIKEKTIDEVVVVGYGKQKKATVTGAVAEVQMDKIGSRSLSGIGEALQGKTSGVTVLSNGGDPTGSPKVSIRGLGGLNGENPLYVVDGVIMDGTPNISTESIESISVLKDASAAIYGSRASGGVVLVTTKHGRKNGKIAIEFDAKYGVQNAWKLKHALDAQEFQSVMYQAYNNVGKLASLPTAFNAQLYPDGGITRTDWVNEIFRTGTLQEYNVNLTGGSEKSNYYLGLNYRENQAILLNTASKQYNVRLNSEHQVKDWLKVGENISYNFKDGNSTDTYSGYTGSILAAMYYPSNVPVYDANGNYSGLPISVAGGYGDVVNPVAMLQRLDYKNPTHSIMINPYIEMKILPGLKFKSNFSQNFDLADEYNFQPKRPEVGKPNMVNSLSQYSNDFKKMLAEQILTYSKKSGKHNLEATAAYTFEKASTQWFSSYGENFPSEDPSQRFMGNAQSNKKVDGGSYRTALLSYLSRINYDYAEKYLISILGRRDGSSLVGENNRFGNYYALSAGWVVSKENFFQNPAVNYFKIRGSYGVLGNLGGISQQSVNPTMSKFDYVIYGLNPAVHTAFYSNVYPNPDLKWGKSEQTDIGLDAAFLNNRLSLQFDYFIKNSRDQIFEKTLPITSNGYQSTYINGGLFQDKGIELSLSYNSPKYGDFSYGFNANFSTLTSTVKEMPNEEIVVTSNAVRQVLAPTRIRVGESLYSFYGYKTDGLFQSQAEIDNYRDASGKLLEPNAKPGDIKFLRKEGNTGQLSSADYVNLGNPFPKATYGFSMNATWKNFDFNAFFQGVYGNKIFNGLKYITLNPGGTGQNYNMDREILNAWTPENTNTNIPRLAIGDPNGNYNKPSDFYIEDGSFLRLKNATIGYTLPSIENKYGINKVRIYVTANNLLTFTKYTGFDPEVGMSHYGVDVGQYPQARSFIMGFTLSL